MIKKFVLLFFTVFTLIIAEGKIVYLTFDDVPNKNTPKLLEILKKEQIKATFFPIGNYIRKESDKDIIRQIKDDGHALGLHTMTHDAKKIYNKSKPETLVNELIQEQDLIESITGERVIIFRPPFGSFKNITKIQADQMVNKGIKLWDWNAGSGDWMHKNVPEIMKTLKQMGTGPKMVVLLHTKDITVKALPEVIKYYRSKGYEFRAWSLDEHFMLNSLKDPRL